MPDENIPDENATAPEAKKPTKVRPDFKASSYTADDLSSLKGLEAFCEQPRGP